METKQNRVLCQGESLEICYFLREAHDATILYLHGLGCSKEDFSAATNLDEMENFTIMAFDFPGCGNSSYPKNARLDMVHLVEIVRKTADAVSLDSPVVIGHSMGGLVGLLYCERYPKAVQGFVNVEGNLSLEDCFISCRAGLHGREEFKKIVFPNLIRELSLTQNMGYQKLVQALKRQTSPEAFWDYSKSLVDYSEKLDLLHMFTHLDMPRLFIRGSESPKHSYLDLLHRSGIRICEISKSDHFPFHDNPEAFFKTIWDFLAELRL